MTIVLNFDNIPSGIQFRHMQWFTEAKENRHESLLSVDQVSSLLTDSDILELVLTSDTCNRDVLGEVQQLQEPF